MLSIMTEASVTSNITRIKYEAESSTDHQLELANGSLMIKSLYRLNTAKTSKNGKHHQNEKSGEILLTSLLLYRATTTP